MKITIDGINVEFDGELLVSRGEDGEIRISAPKQKDPPPSDRSDLDLRRELAEKMRDLQPPAPVCPVYPFYPTWPTWPIYPTCPKTVPDAIWISSDTFYRQASGGY